MLTGASLNSTRAVTWPALMLVLGLVALLALTAAGIEPPAASAAKGKACAKAETKKAKKRCLKRKARKKKQRAVVFVGNNWDGTADVIKTPKRKNGTKFRRVARLNIIPDYEQRIAEINSDPVDFGYFLGIRQLVGEGNDQYVDDMYSVQKGRLLVVSRPSFADVVAIRISTGKIVWRFRVDGQRSDHMAISPNGKHVAVSASTGNVVHILDTRSGREVGSFPSGDSPHENTYIHKGARIVHASIGLVYTPADQPEVDTTKGERYFQVVRSRDNRILARVDMGQKLAQAGYPNMSSAVRPMTFSPSERFVYLQVSFFHGFVEYDLRTHRVRRVARLPVAEHAKDIPREQYLLDSAHHGIAMNNKGKRLCIAGTMSDYAAIVSRKTFKYKLLFKGKKPYWSTNSKGGRYCYVSWSGTDTVSVISYAKRKEVARIKVGDHPQRVRTGTVRRGWLKSLRKKRG